MFQVAVILADCQGTDDPHIRDPIADLHQTALSLQISSVFILNLNARLNNSEVDSLKVTCSGLSVYVEAKKLCFLLRRREREMNIAENSAKMIIFLVLGMKLIR